MNGERILNQLLPLQGKEKRQQTEVPSLSMKEVYYNLPSQLHPEG